MALASQLERPFSRLPLSSWGQTLWASLIHSFKFKHGSPKLSPTSYILFLPLPLQVCWVCQYNEGERKFSRQYWSDGRRERVWRSLRSHQHRRPMRSAITVSEWCSEMRVSPRRVLDVLSRSRELWWKVKSTCLLGKNHILNSNEGVHLSCTQKYWKCIVIMYWVLMYLQMFSLEKNNK